MNINEYREITAKSGSNNKRAKYNSVKTTIDGIVFDSKLEAKRFSELKMLERIGEIKSLRLQVTYPLSVNGILVCKYIADFVYVKNGTEVIEDAKGVLTKEYILKKKLMLAIHGITIFEHKTNRGKNERR